MSWQNRIVRYGEEDPRELQANPKNWRKHPDKQAEALETALEDIGWIQDITINERTGRMIDGHLRVKIAIREGEDKVPVKYVDISAEEEERALATLDTITSMAETDKERLAALLDGMRIDSDKMQHLVDQLRKEHRLTRGAKDDQYEPPAKIVTDIQRGDIIQLGRHRVMCGDSTSREDFGRLMNDTRAGIAFTSPPYNVGYINQKGNPRTHKKYLNDEDRRGSKEYLEFLYKALDNTLEHADECFLNIGLVEGNKTEIFQLVVKYRDRFKDIIYWVKNSVSPHIQEGVVNNRVEFILAFGDGKRKFRNPQFPQGTYWNVIEGKPAGNWGDDIKNPYHRILRDILFDLKMERIKKLVHHGGAVILNPLVARYIWQNYEGEE